jgi:PAS domain S-box-containing protein
MADLPASKSARTAPLEWLCDARPWGVFAVAYTAGALSFARAAANIDLDKRRRIGLRLVGLAFGACGAGALLLTPARAPSAHHPYLETVAEFFFIAIYPLTLGAGFTLPRATVTRARLEQIAFDSIVFVVGAGIPLWLYAIAPRSGTTFVDSLVMVVGIVAMNYALMTREPVPTLAVFERLQLALAIFWLADLLYALDSLHGFLRSCPIRWPNLLNLAGIVTGMSAANAIARHRGPCSGGRLPPGSGPLPLLTLTLVASWLVISYHYWDGSPDEFVRLVWCSVSLLIVLLVREINVMRRTSHWLAAEVSAESWKQSEALMRHSSDIIMVIGAGGKVSQSSPAIAPVLGRNPEEVVGRDFIDLVHPSEVEQARAFIGTLVSKEGATNHIRWRLRHADGTYRLLESVGSPVASDGAVKSIVLNSRDVTYRQEMDERLRQSEKMDALGRLVGGIAHNFNNILGSTLLRLEYLRSRPTLPKDVNENLQALEAEARRSANLTRRLVEFGQQQLIRDQRIDWGEQVEALRPDLSLLLGAAMDLVIEVAVTDEPNLVEADPALLRQVVLTLALNAREATEGPGSLRITLQSAASAKPPEGVGAAGPFLCLTLSDTGKGMSEEVRKHLFEPFFTTKGPGHSAGMGLASAHGIIRQHRGWIEVDSTPGKGSTFHIYLPRVYPSRSPFAKRA